MPNNKSVYKIMSMLVMAGMLLFSGQVFGEEEYDEDTYGPQDPIVWSRPVKAVIFHHKTHTMDAGLECDSCHDEEGEMFEMVAGLIEDNEDFTMQALYDGKYCGACHDGEMAFASNSRCTTCHIGVKGYNRMIGVAPVAAGDGHH
jgi:c(7)-type cytochrome triheme protein